MNSDDSTVAPDPRASVTELIEQLSRAQAALKNVLGGEVDAVVDATGHTHLFREAEIALRQSEARHRKILESALDGIISVDQRGRVVGFNPAAEQMFGYMRDEVLGKRLLEIAVPPERQLQYRKIFAGYAAAAKTRAVRTRVEMKLKRRDGTEFPAEVSIQVDVERGDVIFTGFFRDTSDRNRAMDTANRLAAIVASTDAGIISMDLNGLVQTWNPGAQRLFGYAPAEMIGQPITRLVPRERHGEEMAIIRRLCAGEKVEDLETERERKDGTRLYVSITASALNDSEGKPIGVSKIVRDITARKRSEEAVRESEERFRQLAENIHEVFWLSNLDSTEIFYVSPAYERIWDRSCEELLRNPKAWFDAIHPEDKPRVAQTIETRTEDHVRDVTYRIVRRDESIRWIRDRVFPVRDKTGKIVRVAGIAEDITERQKLEAQLLRTQRMESIGTLAGGIAHDLNNVLAPILISIPVFREQITDQDMLGLLDTVESSVKRGASMIRRVLGFARGSEAKRVPVHPRDLVREVEQISFETFPRSIRIQSHVAKDVWWILGDLTQLHQVLLNLTVNARDAMPNGGHLKIQAHNAHLDENYAGMTPDAKPGQYVVLEVSDTGTGIPREIRERIFDPFFTTKEVGKGTGLGLATAHAIVKGHGGFMHVYSEVGKGTVFKVYLPGAMSAHAPASIATTELPRGRGEWVLVVDDEESIRNVVFKTLDRFGYRVILATNGAEAVATYAEHRANIAAVVTDMVMPVMDGAAMIAAIRVLNPKIPIIAASGLVASPEVKHFLTKPYTAESMLRALDDLLHSDPASPENPEPVSANSTADAGGA